MSERKWSWEYGLIGPSKEWGVGRWFLVISLAALVALTTLWFLGVV